MLKLKLFFIVNLLIMCCSTVLAQQHPDSLFKQALELKQSSDFHQSNTRLREASKLFLLRNDSLKWFKAQRTLASNYIYQGKLNKALDILQTLQNPKFNLSDGNIAEIKNELGLIYSKKEAYKKALFLFSEAYELSSRTSGYEKLTSIITNNLALNFYKNRDYLSASSKIEEAIKLKKELNLNLSLAYSYNLAYLIFSKLGMYKKAENYIEKQLAISASLQNEYLMDIGYHNLASLNRKKGNYDKAIIYYQKSLALTRKLGNPFEITQTLLNIGDLYFEAGRLETAYDYYAESLELNRKTGRPGAIYKSIKALTDYYESKGNYAKAHELLTEGLALQDPHSPSSNYASALFALADLELKRGNPDTAFEYAQKGLDWVHKNNLNSMLPVGYRLLGELEQYTDNFDASLGYYRRAYRESKDKLPDDRVWYLIDLAQAYHRVSQDSAFILAEEAFALIESSRSTITDSGLRAGVFSRYVTFYNDVAEWYITVKNNPEKAFELVEAGKSRVLMDELAEARDRIYAELDPSILIKKKAKEKEIDDLFAKLEEAKTATEKTELQQQLNMAELEYQSFLGSLKSQHEGWKNFEYPGAIDAEDAPGLAENHTAIVEYAFSGKKLIIFTITPSGITADIIEAETGMPTGTHLQTLVENYRELIVNKAPSNELEEASAELVELLLAPVLPRLVHTENLLIIPAQSLAHLPFEAMMHEKKYLIETYNIKYLPSVSIYDFIRDPHRTTQKDLFAVAGTGFVDETPLTTTRSQVNFASLPSALIEVDSISTHFENVAVLKNDDVSEAAFKSYALNDFKYIHLATHGDINEHIPSQSGLVLSRETGTETLFGEDGYLNSKEISVLELNSDMVVLSACNTGIGKIVNGEGMLGLQRSFFTAGTSSVLVSLWNVYDRSTADFMNDFYKNFISLIKSEFGLWEKSMHWLGLYQPPLFDYKSKALHTTKLAFIDHPYYHHPVYWAPFVLIGK